MTFLIGFGLVCLGAFLGVFVMAMLTAGSDEDDRREAYWKGRKDMYKWMTEKGDEQADVLKTQE